MDGLGYAGMVLLLPEGVDIFSFERNGRKGMRQRRQLRAARLTPRQLENPFS
jgi:hypothetical protein